MKRNVRSTYDLSRHSSNRHAENNADLKTLLKYVSELRTDAKEFIFHQKMDRVDVSKYFPLENDAMLSEFIDRSDVDGWEQRKKGFYHLMYNAVTTRKDRFSCALLDLLFTRDYIKDHKWPMSGGYCIKKK